ncbi:hypothetical protein KKH05_00270 [Patescibacteria group bacterium]|nr:hypothetical protein [Patescibacteria group bacterium]
MSHRPSEEHPQEYEHRSPYDTKDEPLGHIHWEDAPLLAQEHLGIVNARQYDRHNGDDDAHVDQDDGESLPVSQDWLGDY